MIKQKRTLKLYFGKKLKFVAAVCAVATCFIGFLTSSSPAFSAEGTIAYRKEVAQLPTQEQAMNNLLKINQTPSNMLLRKTFLVRLPAPTNQEKISINFEFTPTQAEKIVFEECIDEFNDIFSVINENYQFEANYTPSQKDLLNPHSIDVKKYDEPSQSTSLVAGRASVPSQNKYSEIDGQETYDSHIELRSEIFKSPLKLSNVFKHEFMHCLGAGDAYKTGSTYQTIMQSASEENAYLKSNDVAFLDALYRSPTNIYSEAYINSYIEDYEIYASEKETNLKNKLETLEYNIWSKSAENIINSIDQMDKAQLIAQIKALGYKENATDDLISLLKANKKINREFGNLPTRFAEAPLAKISYTKIYSYSEYKIPYSFKGQDYTNYFAGSYLSRRDYNAQTNYSKGLSICDNAHGLINPVGALYINIDKYVIEFDINNSCSWKNITKDNISITAKKIHILTDLTPQSYFNSIFKTSASVNTNYNEMIKN